MSDLSDEQRLLMTSATDFVSKRVPIETLDAREGNAPTGPTPLWTEMAELGWLGLMVPEDRGGSGGSIADVELIAECLGSVLLPPPFLASAVAAAAALMAAAGDGTADALLGELCFGTAVPVLVAGGADGSWDRAGGCEWTGRHVTGAMSYVEGGAEADHFIVMAHRAGEPQLVVVARTDRVQVVEQSSIVQGAWSTVRFDSAAGTPIAGAWDAVDSALAHVGVATAGWCAGAGQELLDRTVEYISSRHAFGVPVGSFQAVQHSMADCAIALAEAQSLARRAAKELSLGSDDARRLASIAFVRSTAALVEVSRRCHQVWGGMGFTREAHVHHFSRRAKLVQLSWGGARHHLSVISRELQRREVVIRRYRQTTAEGNGK